MHPSILHGDGARFTNKNANTVRCVQLRSLRSSGKFGMNVIPFFAIPKITRAKHNGEDLTIKVLWEHVVLFLNSGYRGLHPDKDPAGNDWEPGSLESARGGMTFCNG